MKKSIYFLLSIIICSCQNQESNKNDELQAQIAELEAQLENQNSSSEAEADRAEVTSYMEIGPNPTPEELALGMKALSDKMEKISMLEKYWTKIEIPTSDFTNATAFFQSGELKSVYWNDMDFGMNGSVRFFFEHGEPIIFKTHNHGMDYSIDFAHLYTNSACLAFESAYENTTDLSEFSQFSEYPIREEDDHRSEARILGQMAIKEALKLTDYKSHVDLLKGQLKSEIILVNTSDFEYSDFSMMNDQYHVKSISALVSGSKLEFHLKEYTQSMVNSKDYQWETTDGYTTASCLYTHFIADNYHMEEGSYPMVVSNIIRNLDRTGPSILHLFESYRAFLFSSVTPLQYHALDAKLFVDEKVNAYHRMKEDENAVSVFESYLLLQDSICTLNNDTLPQVISWKKEQDHLEYSTNWGFPGMGFWLRRVKENNVHESIYILEEIQKFYQDKHVDQFEIDNYKGEEVYGCYN